MFLFLLLFVMGCTANWIPPAEFLPIVMHEKTYDIFTYQRIFDSVNPIHIYIEGDGNSFDIHGIPTDNPTPRNTFLRDLAVSDLNPNVVYMARPCQYVMNTNCDISDWTDGRFSTGVVNDISSAIAKVAGSRPIVLIGYSGGALLSGLAIRQNPQLNIVKWITIAGVLNHSDWTEYFGDRPLFNSENLNGLPHVLQAHYVASHDSVVPFELSKKWVGDGELIIVPNSKHNRFPDLDLKF
ncbi:MAG: hypothetical protein IKW67_01130 [Alphaproteobacteria bacterium]|nr:hypothetical protein [Alphaproteobacteria bacterium]